MRAWQQVLVRAVELLEVGWTRAAYARSVNGEGVDEQSAVAVAWCAVGAIRRASFELGVRGEVHDRARNELARLVGDSIVAWNDRHRKPDAIIKAFRKAALQ